MKKTKVLFLVVSLLMILGLFAACTPAASDTTDDSTTTTTDSTSDAADTSSDASDASDATDASDKVFKVGIAMKTLNNPYFVSLAENLKKYSEEYGFEVVSILDADQDVTKERENIETFITQGVDFILMDPQDPQGSVASIEAAYEAGIPLICVDNAPDESSNRVATIYSDNKANGMAVGNWTADNYLVGETIYSIMISGEKGNAVGKERRTGLMAGIIESRTDLDADAAWEAAVVMEQELIDKGSAYQEAADFHILGQGWGGWTSEEGLPAAEDLLVANSNVNLILGENDNMLLGALTAVENQGIMDQVTIAAAADGQKEAYELIKEGTSYVATGLNAPPAVASFAVDLAASILIDGVDPYSVPKVQTTPPACINPSNVDEFYDPEALF